MMKPLDKDIVRVTVTENSLDPTGIDEIFHDLVEGLDLGDSVPCEFNQPFHTHHGSGEASKRLTYGHDCGVHKVLLVCDGCLDQFKSMTNLTCTTCDTLIEIIAVTIIKIEDI